MTDERIDLSRINVSWNLVKGKPVPVGNGVALPRAFTASLELSDGTTASMEVEVIDRRLVCRELKIPMAKGRALRLPVQRWLEAVSASVAMTVDETSPGSFRFQQPTTAEEVGRVDEAVRQASRRRISADLLERTANAYRAGGVNGVRAALAPLSEAQAYRYIRRAREQGILEPREA